MFAEKVVIITGASSGLGRQLARDLAARRCRVVLFARNADALAEAVAECEAAGGEAMAVTGDSPKIASASSPKLLSALAALTFSSPTPASVCGQSSRK
jgi:NAD(P)-dependent dehydrogenase (short-subunit alcohol dehydrogenase family)